MTPQAALLELLARIGSGFGAPILVSEYELSLWPSAAVMAMKAQRLLTKARPATSAICPGCERECVMPVHVLQSAKGSPAAFIVCDKPSDFNRVPVPVSLLEQWQASCDLIADALAVLLGVTRPDAGSDHSGRRDIGVLKGAKHTSRIVLSADGALRLSLAGHSVPLVDVLAIDEHGVTLDRGELFRLVDQPVGDAGEVESPEQRRARLKTRVRQERIKGTKAFLRVVAKEEGFSVSRLKQLVAETTAQSEASGVWSGLFPSTGGASSKNRQS